MNLGEQPKPSSDKVDTKYIFFSSGQPKIRWANIFPPCPPNSYAPIEMMSNDVREAMMMMIVPNKKVSYFDLFFLLPTNQNGLKSILKENSYFYAFHIQICYFRNISN